MRRDKTAEMNSPDITAIHDRHRRHSAVSLSLPLVLIASAKHPALSLNVSPVIQDPLRNATHCFHRKRKAVPSAPATNTQYTAA